MFLYPIGLMTRPRIFLEHSHRLFGTFAGLTTMVLTFCTLISKRPRWAKAWSVGLFVLVVIQGVIGGYRVNHASSHLALVHGITAQLFFGLTVAFAAAMSPLFDAIGRTEPSEISKTRTILDGVSPVVARRLKLLATGATHALILQLILGATFRHLREPHALWAHMAFSLVVMGFATAAGSVAQQVAMQAPHGRFKRTMKVIGSGMITSVGVQFLLGWATWWVVQSSDRPLPTGDQVLETPQVSTIAALLPTLHQANGAVLLAFTTLAYVWSMRLKKVTNQF
jgi:cytochrome c oxidase assembly protein subunit 15